MRQIKSRKRVKAFGEVFTAEREVRAMCDLIPDWSGNVLEPACGNGNFLVEIARRKLASGMTAEEAVHRLKGIRCGAKSTSCPDQLACGLEAWLNQQKQ